MYENPPLPPHTHTHPTTHLAQVKGWVAALKKKAFPSRKIKSLFTQKWSEVVHKYVAMLIRQMALADKTVQ